MIRAFLARTAAALSLPLAVAAFLAASQPASATTLFTETFTGTTTATNAWTYGSSASPAVNPCLTATRSSTSGSIPGCPRLDSTGNTAIGGNTGHLPDASGSGALRLTDQGNNQSGFVLNNTAIPTANGLQITFDLYSYGGYGDADGIGFLIVDGSQSPTTAGGYGGSLGYAPHTPVAGLVGAYVGVGFDEFGNFSNPTEGRTGGPGFVPQAVAVRGAASTNYQYLAGTGTLSQSISNNQASTRSAALRKVRIILTPAGVLSVDIDFGSGYVNEIYGLNLNTISGQPTLPSTIKIGFAASTGGSTNIHEINTLLVTSGAPQLTAAKSHTGSFAVGSTGSYSLAVTNSGTAPTNANITLVDTLPTGETYNTSSGMNWSCSSSAPTVTCTYSGASIAAGSTTPTLTLTVNVPSSTTPGILTNSATASGGGALGGSTATDPTNVTGTAALTITKTGTAQAAPGGLLAYQVVVKNSGPAVATNVAFSDPIPSGLIIRGTPTCTTSGTATCGTVTVNGQTISSTITSLGVNGSVTFAIATAPPLTGYAGNYTNTATITPPAYLTDPNSTSSTYQTSVATTYGITKTVRDVTAGQQTGQTAILAKPGDTLEYALTFQNLTGSALSGISITDVVPANLTYVAGSMTCSISPTSGAPTCTPTYTSATNTATWTLTGTALAPNATITAIFRATVN